MIPVQVRILEVHNKSRRPYKAPSFTEEEEEVLWKAETFGSKNSTRSYFFYVVALNAIFWPIMSSIEGKPISILTIGFEISANAATSIMRYQEEQTIMKTPKN